MFIALFRIVDLFTICTVFRWIAHHKNVHVRGSLFAKPKGEASNRGARVAVSLYVYIYISVTVSS